MVAAGKRVEKDAERRTVFGRMLAQVLLERAMTQEDFARTVGIAQSSVSGWINGRYEPAPNTVFTVELALKVEPGSLSRALGFVPVTPMCPPVSVEAAIAENTNLDDDAKAALVALYRVLER